MVWAWYYSQGKVTIEAKARVKFEIPDGAIFASKVINGPYDKGNCDMLN